MTAAVLALPARAPSADPSHSPRNAGQAARPGKITALAQARAIRQRPITDACRWLDAWQLVAEANLRAAFAWQRTCLRAITGL